MLSVAYLGGSMRIITVVLPVAVSGVHETSLFMLPHY